MPTITVTSTYRKAKATLRPRAAIINGRKCLIISRRAFRRAEENCSYAGTDGVHLDSIPLVDGYGKWAETPEGDLRAWELPA
jgi:hypothetical protein